MYFFLHSVFLFIFYIEIRWQNLTFATFFLTVTFFIYALNVKSHEMFKKRMAFWGIYLVKVSKHDSFDRYPDLWSCSANANVRLYPGSGCASLYCWSGSIYADSIRLFTVMRAWNLFLIKMMGICDHWSTQSSVFEHPRLPCQRLQSSTVPFWESKAPNFDVNADPDSSFHFNADLDPSSQNYAGTDPQPCRLRYVCPHIYY
jgi:hypothetical protein